MSKPRPENAHKVRNIPIEQLWSDLVRSRKEALAQQQRCIDAMRAAGQRQEATNA